VYAPIARFLAVVLIGVLASLQAWSETEQAQPTELRSFALARSPSFSITYYQGFKLVTVRSPWPGATQTYKYLLSRRGEAKPDPRVFSEARRIETPVRRVASFSTSYLPAITSIGEAASVVGVDAAAYVNDPAIRARIEAGAAVEVTKNYLPDIERILSLGPDAVFTYGMGNEWDSHPKLIEAGLPVVIDGEWNEVDPLARAEWVVFIAAFYDKEDQAEAWFRAVEKNYLALKALAQKATTTKPRVINNGPYQGTWAVSGGESFMARLIADAGGAYLWADTKGTGGLNLSIEAAYERALKADVWISPSLYARRLGDVIALDRRFAKLPVVEADSVWNNDLRMNASGGNDFFESAVIHPDLVLADLIAIFHPELEPGHRYIWFRRLER
jgi:iron complex transport system substrate-binding protein